VIHKTRHPAAFAQLLNVSLMSLLLQFMLHIRYKDPLPPPHVESLLFPLRDSKLNGPNFHTKQRKVTRQDQKKARDFKSGIDAIQYFFLHKSQALTVTLKFSDSRFDLELKDVCD